MNLTSPLLHKVDNIIVYDDEGAGRCWIGKVMLEDNIKETGIPVTAVGLGSPQSGRDTIHPDVARCIQSRYRVDLAGSKIVKLDPSLLTEHTVALGLTRRPTPEFLRQKALDIFLGEVVDPFPALGDALEEVATQIYYDAWMLGQILTSRSEIIGSQSRENGLVIPQYLSALHYPVEGGYSRETFRYHNDNFFGKPPHTRDFMSGRKGFRE